MTESLFARNILPVGRVKNATNSINLIKHKLITALPKLMRKFNQLLLKFRINLLGSLSYEHQMRSAQGDRSIFEQLFRNR